MPYREATLAGANANALAEEMRAELDAALLASGKYTKVTSAFAGTVGWVYDVWRNDGTTDGYQWYVVVAKNQTTAHVLLGGMLEYDDPTKTAKKALRGYVTSGFVDAAGYPLVSAGGAEMTFPLDKFIHAPSTNNIGSLGGVSSLPTAAATGNKIRTLVTGQLVYQSNGPASSQSHGGGVGTYQRTHSTTVDLKPLANIGVPSSSGGPTTVWQHPLATDNGYSRSNNEYSTSYTWMNGMLSSPYGEVGGKVDLLTGGVIGSRLAVLRVGSSNKNSPSTGVDTGGSILGIVPSDILVFARTAGCARGDTITVNGKVYVSIDTPGTNPGLFINTQPAV